MLESIILFLQDIPAWGVFLGAFFFAYIENVFPPSPSDIILVFVGTLCGVGTVDYAPTLIIATLGSSTGFLTAFLIGKRYGRSIIEKGWLPFISLPLIDKVEVWFSKYHDWIIVGNRFLAGTRAVISFAAGMSRMPTVRTTVLSTISALVWNAIILFLGMQAGSRWREIQTILSAYGWIVLGLIVLIVVGRWWYKKRKRQTTK